MRLDETIYNSEVELINVIGEKMPDEKYFKIPAISNSKLSLLNPIQGGNLQKYLEGFKHDYNSSLLLGTCVHGIILSPDEIVVSDYRHKPSGKIGYFIEQVFNYRVQNHSIEESLKLASEECDYYKDKFTQKVLRNVIQKGLRYYLDLTNGMFTVPGKDVYVLPEKQLENCYRCVNALKNNFHIKRILTQNLFKEKIFLNEYAFFADFKVTLPDTKTVTLKLKGKADSIVIDPEKKIVYLNDIKTTSKPLSNFMDKVISGKIVDGVLSHHHYYRQFALYLLFLKWHCEKTLGLKDYTYKVNVWAVETTGENNADNFPINQAWLNLGKQELKELLVELACYEAYGYDIDFD